MDFNTIQQFEGGFFQKISITYTTMDKTVETIVNLLFKGKTPLPSNQSYSQSFTLLTTKLGEIQYWCMGKQVNLKNYC